MSEQCDRQEAIKPVGARPEVIQPVGARPEAVIPVGARPAEAPTKVVERPQRHCPTIKQWGIDKVYLSEMNFVHSAFSAEVVPEPTTMREDLSSPESKRWREAAQAEFDSLRDHNTWDLCELPPGRKLIGSKWVFKVKYGESGKIDRFKCRVVALGFSQISGTDYSEIFAPVARFGTIRTLLAIGVQRGMNIQQMDVTTAFLNGNLKEDLFMAQPSGFEEKGCETLVCRLKKSLYGLKQSPRCWYEELSKHLVSTGFKQSRADPCVFYKWSNGNLTVISVYVDALILQADLVQEMLEVKEQLSRRFRMKDLGDLNYCLGIGVSQGDGWIQLQQRQYILNLLHRFELADAHPLGNADTNVPLEADDDVSQPADQKLYQRMIGSLQYAAGGTRPDIAYFVSVLTRFCGKPNNKHLNTAKRVFRYLKGTQDLSLTYT